MSLKPVGVHKRIMGTGQKCLDVLFRAGRTRPLKGRLKMMFLTSTLSPKLM